MHRYKFCQVIISSISSVHRVLPVCKSEERVIEKEGNNRDQDVWWTTMAGSSEHMVYSMFMVPFPMIDSVYIFTITHATSLPLPSLSLPFSLYYFRHMNIYVYIGALCLDNCVYICTSPCTVS